MRVCRRSYAPVLSPRAYRQEAQGVEQQELRPGEVEGEGPEPPHLEVPLLQELDLLKGPAARDGFSGLGGGQEARTGAWTGLLSSFYNVTLYDSVQ